MGKVGGGHDQRRCETLKASKLYRAIERFQHSAKTSTFANKLIYGRLEKPAKRARNELENEPRQRKVGESKLSTEKVARETEEGEKASLNTQYLSEKASWNTRSRSLEFQNTALEF